MISKISKVLKERKYLQKIELCQQVALQDWFYAEVSELGKQKLIVFHLVKKASLFKVYHESETLTMRFTSVSYTLDNWTSSRNSIVPGVEFQKDNF